MPTPVAPRCLRVSPVVLHQQSYWLYLTSISTSLTVTTCSARWGAEREALHLLHDDASQGQPALLRVRCVHRRFRSPLPLDRQVCRYATTLKRSALHVIIA